MDQMAAFGLDIRFELMKKGQIKQKITTIDGKRIC